LLGHGYGVDLDDSHESAHLSVVRTDIYIG
jgi:hypothetical protein